MLGNAVRLYDLCSGVWRALSWGKPSRLRSLIDWLTMCPIIRHPAGLPATVSHRNSVPVIYPYYTTHQPNGRFLNPTAFQGKSLKWQCRRV
uniref:Uncharacterized protein n=1 Tax=Anguilla anguilla TaxID=7936 RepID=A0A0E9WYH5_ANGAN